MLVTLAFFIVGALIGTAHLPWWLTLPSFGTIDLGRQLGTGAAILATLAGLGVVSLLTALVEQRAHGDVEREPAPSRQGWTWGNQRWSMISTDRPSSLSQIVW